MSSNPSDAEFEKLCDASIDGRASADQLRRLEEVVLASPERRQQYAEAVALHGSLCLLGSEAFDRGRATATAERAAGKPWRRAPSWVSPTGVAALAAALLVAVGFWAWSTHDRDLSFAQLESTSGCLWEESATPTHEGQRIGVGHFRLAEGLAAIRFDNGARVDLEGPAHLEVLSHDRCQLHNGKLVVTIENDFKGFMVETPNGRLIDQGTSFGVSVEEDGASVVEVFGGRVDVEHRVSGESRRLGEEAAVRLLSKMIVDESDYVSPAGPEKARSIQVTTATQRGEDCWIFRDPTLPTWPADLLLAKKPRPNNDRFHRRIYLKFDLSHLPTQNLKKATLQLTATPSGKGFASRTPDSTFAVYGVTDDTQDDWSAETLTWQASPGFAGDELQPDAARLLGRFVIPKGQQSGSFILEEAELTALVRAESNQLVTLMVIGETMGTKWGGLVHSFASSRHETLPPPTLRLWFER